MKTIGFIGLGIMGESMCANLINERDEDVVVYDIVEKKVDQMVELGAQAANSNSEVAAKSDIIISMVPKSEHVEAVYEDIKEELTEEKLWIDMSTIKPSVSKKLSEKVRATGADMVDSPVVKSKSAAVDGTLGIYFGGKREIFEDVKEILLTMGEDIIYLGDNGSGLVMKICHNMLVGQIQNGVNEMLTMAQNSDIDIDDFTRAISYGGGQNFYLDAKAESIKERDFTTAFSVENMNKDVGIAKSIKENMRLDLPGIDLVKKVYDQAMDLGYGSEDFSATIKVIENRN